MLEHSSLHVVVSSSALLRDQLLSQLTAGWSGERRVQVDPPDLGEMALAAASPSLFGGGEMLVVRCEEPLIKQHSAQLSGLVGQAVSAGVVIVVTSRLAKKEALAKALIQAEAYHSEEPPFKGFHPYVTKHLAAADPAPARPGQVARALIDHCGEDLDQVMMSYAVAAHYAGDEAVDVDHVTAMVNGVAAKPIYELTGAFLEGDVRTALRLLHADRALDPEPVLAGLTNEIRRCLASLESDDDGDVNRLLGRRGKPANLYYVRRRAQGLGKRCLMRLLSGVLAAQAECRKTGVHRDLVMEQLIINAQRVIRSVHGR